MNWSLSLAPSLSPPVLTALAILGLLTVAALAFGRRRGALMRALAFAVLLIAIGRPAIVAEDRKPVGSVVAVIRDRSPSQAIGTRAADTDAATAGLVDRLGKLPGVEVRVIDAADATGNTPGNAPGNAPGNDGTRLFSALAEGLSDVPPERIAGAVLVTDGEVHDVPDSVAALGFAAPVHALITGEPDEFDRRVVLDEPPKFGLVKKTVDLSFHIEDQGKAPAASPAVVTVRRDGEIVEQRTLVPGQTATITADIPHAGPNIFEIETPPAPGELTAANNGEVAVVEGIREALRVLLVSGEPHPGERAWRNLLKSDPSVDLVHFTILRPADKLDSTPIDELSLIAFPTRELFDEKIGDFDLIIFDRYERRGVLPTIYFDNIARYVDEGGALLIAAGPDPLNDDSIYDTPLAPILPAIPTGKVIEAPFRPTETAVGRRHPVTRDLGGADADPPGWSRWFRMIETRGRGGEDLLAGSDDNPLLVLSHRGKGRVAMLLSDEAWLWARDFEGGGPYVELFRNVAHWLMAEPDLEEEALRLTAGSGDLVISRQTLADRPPPITLTGPDGKTRPVGGLSEERPGLFRARVAAPAPGLYRATDGERTALAHVGPVNPREQRAQISTTAILEPIARASGGSVRRLHPRPGSPILLPDVALQDRAANHAGNDFIGFSRSAAYEVTGVVRHDLSVGLLALAALLAALGGLWCREGH